MLAVTVTESDIAQESTPMLSKLVLRQRERDYSDNVSLRTFTEFSFMHANKLFEFKAV